MGKWKRNPDYKNYLICKGVKFYVQKDEDLFFEWIERINCIESFDGSGDELYLDLADRELDCNDIRELAALFIGIISI